MKTQKTADIVVGCLIALLGAFIIYQAMLITGIAAHRLHPRTFPLIVGILLLICGMALAAKSWSLQGEDLAIPWPDAAGFITILVTLVSLGVYIAIINTLGMPLATFLYVAFSIWFLKRSKWLMAVIIGLISAIILYYLFIQALGLSFPAGFFLEG